MKFFNVQKISLNIALTLMSLFIAAIAGEVMLRAFPLPGVYFDVYRFDPLVGVGFHPNSILAYRDDRGEAVSRAINSLGYPDKEPESLENNANSLYNIGFFGDSYTEARQVALQSTFVRLVETELSGDGVETKAFGVSGFGAHQSYLTYKRWAEQFKFDLVVYVFVENDLGDQIREIKKSNDVPYPILNSDGLSFDNSFRKRNKKKESLIFEVGDYLTARSLVFATISSRIRLLAEYGIKPSLTEDERLMATAFDNAFDAQLLPDQNDAPSSWPDQLREHAKALGEAVILEWAKAARDHSAEFVILYVPRESELSKPTEIQDSWKAWLSEFCAAHEIQIIDPTSELIRVQENGLEVYYDHFTKNGHRAMADSFVEWFIEHARK